MFVDGRVPSNQTGRERFSVFGSLRPSAVPCVSKLTARSRPTSEKTRWKTQAVPGRLENLRIYAGLPRRAGVVQFT